MARPNIAKTGAAKARTAKTAAAKTPPRKKLALYRKASPMHYSPPAPPPVLLVHGSDDTVVPVRQAHALAERLRGRAGKASVVVLDGEGHTFNGYALLQSIDQMLTFLDETLKK